MTSACEETEKKRDTSRDVIFAFGLKGDYFLSTNDPKNNAYTFTVRDSNFKSLKNLPLLHDIYSVAIGAEGGIFLACKSVDHKTPSWTYTGRTGLAWDLMDSRLFDKISSVYGASLEDLQKINLVLGPKGSYFTTSKDGPVYRDIPAQLHEKIKSQALIDVKPRQLSLGQNDSYICLWDDLTISYSVNLSYTGLAEKMQEYIDKEGKPPAFIAMNPYDNYSWFLVDADGQCAWHLQSMDKTAIKGIQEAALSYLQRRAREDSTCFTETTTFNGKERSLRVTPQTYFDTPYAVNVNRLADKFPEPVSRLVAMMREPLIGERGRRNAVVFGCASVNIAVACKIRGMDLRSSLVYGGLAGAITLAGYSLSVTRTSNY
ncbi:hypothetical protein E2P81_ATG07297 [Venturia nashicola]|nr:hypothetical protein E2P81_ATG07297 [Venturia nashicola]